MYSGSCKLNQLKKDFDELKIENQTDYNLSGFTAALDGYSYLEDNKAHFGGEGLVSTMKDFAKFCEMLVNEGNFNGTQIVSKKGIEIMTSKYSNGYPDSNEPFAFPDLVGYYYGFTFTKFFCQFYSPGNINTWWST